MPEHLGCIACGRRVYKRPGEGLLRFVRRPTLRGWRRGPHGWMCPRCVTPFVRAYARDTRRRLGRRPMREGAYFVVEPRLLGTCSVCLRPTVSDYTWGGWPNVCYTGCLAVAKRMARDIDLHTRALDAFVSVHGRLPQRTPFVGRGPR